MKLKIKIFIIILALFFANFTFAKVQKPLKYKLRFGFNVKTGNTESANLKGKYSLKYKKNKWLADFSVGGQIARSSGVKSAANFDVNANSQYSYKEKRFIFTNLKYNYDQFDPYLYSGTFIEGHGWHLYEDKKIDFIFRLGIGPRIQKEADSDTVINDFIVYGDGAFKWKISDNATFSQTFSIEDGKNNTVTQAKSALKTAIIGNLAMETSFEVKRNSTIPKFSTNTHKTDTTTSLVFIYSF